MSRQVVMPRLSEDMVAGRVQEWLKAPGDAVEEGDPLLSVESDKVTMDIVAPVKGIVLKLLASIGDEVEVGAPVAIIGDVGEDLEANRTAPSDGRHATTVRPVPPLAELPQVPGESGSTLPRRPISPAARRRAAETGISLNEVVGTGLMGAVTEADIQAHEVRIQSERSIERVPFTGVRRRTADRLSASRHAAADVTTFAEVDMGAVLRQRKLTGGSYLAFVIAASAHALLEHRLLNCSLEQDELVFHPYVNIGVAVEGESGLVVPVVRDADAKSVLQISSEIDSTAARARRSELTVSDMSGGTFTVTNSGSFGSLFFTPIILLPQVAILGMGKIHDAVVVRGGRVATANTMFLCLSYDHRVVDGKQAVQFLRTVCDRLESVGSAWA